VSDDGPAPPCTRPASARPGPWVQTGVGGAELFPKCATPPQMNDTVLGWPLVACRGANITRLRLWSAKRYLLNQLHSGIDCFAVPDPQ